MTFMVLETILFVNEVTCTSLDDHAIRIVYLVKTYLLLTIA